MKITQALMAEHAVFHNLFDYIERVTPKLKTLAEIKALAGLLGAMLDAHSQMEDELIIEPLEHCFEQLGQRETFHQEHEEIDHNLKLAQATRQLKAGRKFLLAAVLASRRHFDKEERVVFPMAEKLLKNKNLLALGKTWLNKRPTITA